MNQGRVTAVFGDRVAASSNNFYLRTIIFATICDLPVFQTEWRHISNQVPIESLRLKSNNLVVKSNRHE